MATSKPSTGQTPPDGNAIHDPDSLRSVDEQHVGESEFDVFRAPPALPPSQASAPDSAQEAEDAEKLEFDVFRATAPNRQAPLEPASLPDDDEVDSLELGQEDIHAFAQDGATKPPPPIAAGNSQYEPKPGQPQPQQHSRADGFPTVALPSVNPGRKRAPAHKLGIIGGKGVGKSYLFQSMVYRTCSRGKSGALAYYLDGGGVRLRSSPVDLQDHEYEEDVVRFVDAYQAWDRLSSTLFDDQRWYRLRLPYRTGLLGLRRRELEVEFFDGSGEYLLEKQVLNDKDKRLWWDAYLGVTTMVFCLPLWTVFPNGGLTKEDHDKRSLSLKGFGQVVANFREMREEFNINHPVRSILALTMADDTRSALVTLRDRWITPYMDSPEHYLKTLRKGCGVALYLANARKVSECLHREFESHQDPLISGIPDRLDFNGGRPWLIPLSAVEGKMVDIKENSPQEFDRFPIPVHVELPLLVALCERENALM
ncbi:MAG: hypothetical protein DM484_02585 [Candidatus Methylumidiphilus alinenensis]|uniref:Uncharacterized protein n=1 Tax=Candidatus Methylumidiphilus alinenensis TaxID=2202197 RepID=A0A2W4TBB4_9GAMM|nr:MAG: hypothetical protein DM484_02585 [Candidatus Methylumidiphilus alinenensis]